jgi:hypothetical protein
MAAPWGLRCDSSGVVYPLEGTVATSFLDFIRNKKKRAENHNAMAEIGSFFEEIYNPFKITNVMCYYF